MLLRPSVWPRLRGVSAPPKSRRCFRFPKPSTWEAQAADVEATPCHFGLVCCSPRMCFSYRDAGMSFGSCESQPISSSHGALASAVLTSFWAAYAESPSHPHAGGPTLPFISLVAAAVSLRQIWAGGLIWVFGRPSRVGCCLIRAPFSVVSTDSGLVFVAAHPTLSRDVWLPPLHRLCALGSSGPCPSARPLRAYPTIPSRWPALSSYRADRLRCLTSFFFGLRVGIVPSAFGPACPWTLRTARHAMK